MGKVPRSTFSLRRGALTVDMSTNRWLVLNGARLNPRLQLELPRLRELHGQLLAQTAIHPRSARPASPRTSPVLDTVTTVLGLTREPMRIADIHAAAEQRRLTAPADIGESSARRRSSGLAATIPTRSPGRLPVRNRPRPEVGRLTAHERAVPAPPTRLTSRTRLRWGGVVGPWARGFCCAVGLS